MNPTVALRISRTTAEISPESQRNRPGMGTEFCATIRTSITLRPITVGSGTDVAAATADIILVNSNPRDITALIMFGRATYRRMVQNLIWATGYNVVAIPLAAGVLSGVGIILSPEVGAILMSLSTVIVAINARLLKVKRTESPAVAS